MVFLFHSSSIIYISVKCYSDFDSIFVPTLSKENKSTVDRDEEKPGHADVVPEQEPVLGPSVDKQCIRFIPLS